MIQNRIRQRRTGKWIFGFGGCGTVKFWKQRRWQSRNTRLSIGSPTLYPGVRCLATRNAHLMRWEEFWKARRFTAVQRDSMHSWMWWLCLAARKNSLSMLRRLCRKRESLERMNFTWFMGSGCIWLRAKELFFNKFGRDSWRKLRGSFAFLNRYNILNLHKK